MQNNLERFDDLWESFITAVKGSLRSAAKEKKLDYKHAQAILAEQKMSWQNDYAAEGKWINDLNEHNQAKAELVRRILVQDMQFSELSKPSSSVTPQIIGAIGGGAIGYGIAAASDFSTLGTVVTTAATLAVGGIVGNNVSYKKKTAVENATINEYASQLDSYYHSVVAALNA